MSNRDEHMSWVLSGLGFSACQVPIICHELYRFSVPVRQKLLAPQDGAKEKRENKQIPVDFIIILHSVVSCIVQLRLELQSCSSQRNQARTKVAGRQPET